MNKYDVSFLTEDLEIVRDTFEGNSEQEVIEQIYRDYKVDTLRWIFKL